MSARSTLVTDTGVLYAGIVEDEVDHLASRRLLQSGPSVTVPVPVLGEVDFLGRSRGHPLAAAFAVQSFLDGSMLLYDLDREDWARVLELVVTYDDLPLGLVDASVVAVAERLEEETIATLDRKHFSVVRPRHVPAFTLVP